MVLTSLPVLHHVNEHHGVVGRKSFSIHHILATPPDGNGRIAGSALKRIRQDLGEKHAWAGIRQTMANSI